MARAKIDVTDFTDGVSSVAFSPDGKRIISGSGDNTLKVWDATSGQETLTLKGHTGCVMSVAFSPDGWRQGPTRRRFFRPLEVTFGKRARRG